MAAARHAYTKDYFASVIKRLQMDLLQGWADRPDGIGGGFDGGKLCTGLTGAGENATGVDSDPLSNETRHVLTCPRLVASVREFDQAFWS